MQTKSSLADAIAREEGFYVPDSRASRNHNPGNIVAGKFAQMHGSLGSDGRFAIFENDFQGFAALEALLKSAAYFKLTIQQAISRYAPASENDTAKYIENVCKWTGAKPTDLVEHFV